MTLRPGDHVCSLYETNEQLIETVAAFLADGLTRNERCWYVPGGSEAAAVRSGLERRGVDVDAETGRGALHLLDSNATYAVQGGFDPEQTLRVFNDAIEQALSDGFAGFRAAAEMSWVLTVDNGAETVIAYEALLKTLFATAPATGLCLYDRHSIPPRVLAGALQTHPIVEAEGRFVPNAAYDPRVSSLSDVKSP